MTMGSVRKGTLFNYLMFTHLGFSRREELSSILAWGWGALLPDGPEHFQTPGISKDL
jgi:hypothetical protein